MTQKTLPFPVVTYMLISQTEVARETEETRVSAVHRREVSIYEERGVTTGANILGRGSMANISMFYDLPASPMFSFPA